MCTLIFILTDSTIKMHERMCSVHTKIDRKRAVNGNQMQQFIHFELMWRHDKRKHNQHNCFFQFTVYKMWKHTQYEPNWTIFILYSSFVIHNRIHLNIESVFAQQPSQWQAIILNEQLKRILCRTFYVMCYKKQFLKKFCFLFDEMGKSKILQFPMYRIFDFYSLIENMKQRFNLKKISIIEIQFHRMKIKSNWDRFKWYNKYVQLTHTYPWSICN